MVKNSWDTKPNDSPSVHAPLATQSWLYFWESSQTFYRNRFCGYFEVPVGADNLLNQTYDVIYIFRWNNILEKASKLDWTMHIWNLNLFYYYFDSVTKINSFNTEQNRFCIWSSYVCHLIHTWHLTVLLCPELPEKLHSNRPKLNVWRVLLESIFPSSYFLNELDSAAESMACKDPLTPACARFCHVCVFWVIFDKTTLLSAIFLQADCSLFDIFVLVHVVKARRCISVLSTQNIAL